MATLLRFIPYLGPVIAAVFPITLAFVVDPGWSMLLWAIALILTIELISNNAVEPWLYGASTGLSSFAIIIAAIETDASKRFMSKSPHSCFLQRYRSLILGSIRGATRSASGPDSESRRSISAANANAASTCPTTASMP